MGRQLRSRFGTLQDRRGINR